mgnify:CR=1 FL=1
MVAPMGYLPQLMYGALITLGVALSAVLFGAAFGLLGAMAKLSASRPLRAVAEAYTIVVRGTPDLIIILIVTLIQFWMQKRWVNYDLY